MPDTIRITRGCRVGRWLGEAALTIAACGITADAHAEPSEVVTVQAYVAAIAQLDGHEIAALGLTLGILCFAVVTAIMLVRTRRRLAETEAAARDLALALRARADRANALLQSEPQVVIAWSTTDEEPEIIGDPHLVTDLAAPDHVLVFGSWLEAEQAQAIESA